MITKRIDFFSLLLILLIFGCGGADTKGKKETATLTIAAAANVQFAMKEIEAAYEANYNTDITVIIGSSGKLTAQITQGAPYDLLISANMKYPNNLYENGHATTAPKVYALGALVLWTMKNDLVLDEALTVLKNPTIRKIAIANPKNAPYGEEAINAFNYFGFQELIIPKLVYAESIAQTNQYILTKNCEVGVTAKSVVSSPEMQGKGTWMDIPTNAYRPITQGVIITKYGAKNHSTAANNFYQFLFSREAGQIFEKYGYSIP